MNVTFPGGAVIAIVHVRPLPVVVQFGESLATFAITGAVTPLIAIETEFVEGDKNCGRRLDDEAEAEELGKFSASDPATDMGVGVVDAPPPPEQSASANASTVAAMARPAGVIVPSLCLVGGRCFGAHFRSAARRRRPARRATDS